MRTLNLNTKDYGDGQRLSFQENELANAAIVPNPVEYEDIDNAFCDFFKDNLTIVDENGKKFGTYTFFSSQRFSEFSQTWGHDDEEGNLLMNFFTISRDNNPNWGTLHGGTYNIPGRNRFTILMREILDDTGVECYEITSMSQPIQVDVKYRLNLVTGKFKYLNEFNTKINYLFDAKQCYLCVNGHYMPMTLENINDSSDYTIDGRKFYVQSMDIMLKAYIISRDDIKVNLVPKRRKVTTNLKEFDKTIVSMEFDDDDDEKFMLNIKFKKGITKVRFNSDEKMKLTFNKKVNANNITMKINDEEVNLDSNIVLDADDDVYIKIVQPNPTESSEINFNGEITT
jgi:hypothetical protein